METAGILLAYDKELLAIYVGIRYFRHLLEARTFVIKTDHQPLVLRQFDFIAQFSTEIIHISGQENVVADALSRRNQINMPVSLENSKLQQKQKEDDELRTLLQNTTSLRLQKLALDNNITLYCEIANGSIRPYIPKSLRRLVFNSIHGLALPNGRATARQISQRYVWPGMRKDILEWARTCLACQRSKIQRHNQLIPKKIDVPSSRFDHVHLDIVMIPEAKQYRYCLTMIDRFSRDISADTIATEFYNNWVPRFGVPKMITTDQGSQFESVLFSSLANKVLKKIVLRHIILRQRTLSSNFQISAHA